jgi:hypothetical protein
MDVVSNLILIKRAGGPAVFAQALNGVVTVRRVRGWLDRNAIPPLHWRAIELAGLATYQELRAAHDARRAERGLPVPASAAAILARTPPAVEGPLLGQPGRTSR